MFKQIPPPSEDDLRACFGPDFAMEWDQARVTRWLQDHNWGHIADTFQGKLRVCVQTRMFPFADHFTPRTWHLWKGILPY